MTREDLEPLGGAAYWVVLSEATVPWVTAGGMHGHTRSPSIGSNLRLKPQLVPAGDTLSCLSLNSDPDFRLDPLPIDSLLNRSEGLHPTANPTAFATR